MVRFTLVENARNSNRKKVLSNFGGLFMLKDLWRKFHLDELLKSLGIVKDRGLYSPAELSFLCMSQSVVGSPSEKDLAEKACLAGNDPCLCAKSVPQKEVNRFLNRDRFDFKELFLSLTVSVLFHKKIGKKLRNKRSKNILIVDDSPLEKSGKKMQGISKLYNSSKNGFYHGYELVALALAAGTSSFLLDFTLKPKSPKPAKKDARKKPDITKLTLAADLIAHAKASGIPAGIVTFDLWYTAVTFLKRLVEMHLDFVAPLKKNRLVLYHGKRRQATYFIKRCHQTREWGKIFAVDLPHFGPVHLVVFKRPLRNRKTRIEVLITNDLKLPSQRILAVYQKRWTIETLFREAKQTFGLEGFHNRKRHAIVAHLCFSLMAMLFIRTSKFFFKSLQAYTAGAIKKQLIQTTVEIEITMKQWKITFYEKNRFLPIFQLNLALEDV